MIEAKISCDICKQEIRPLKYDAIAIQGNLCVPDLENYNGVGGGILGNRKWLQKLGYKPETNNHEPVNYEDIPIHHIHLDCVKGIISTNTRG